MPRCKWCGKEESEHQHDYFKSCFGPMDSRNTHYEPMPNPSREEIEAPLRAEIERLRGALRWAMTYVDADHEKGCNNPVEVGIAEAIRAALAPSAPEEPKP